MSDYYGGGWSPNKFKWYGLALLVALVARLLYVWATS
jgi:hypothetical protein